MGAAAPPRQVRAASGDAFARAPLPRFVIHAEHEGPLGRSGGRRIETSLEGAAKERIDSGWTNPLYILSMGFVGPAVLAPRTRTEAHPPTAAAKDAIGRLHRAAADAGVTGLSLWPREGATFEFADRRGVFVSGGEFSARLGPRAALLEQLAREVLSAL